MSCTIEDCMCGNPPELTEKDKQRIDKITLGPDTTSLWYLREKEFNNNDRSELLKIKLPEGPKE